ncbi:PocR ligand-binding domain-containing protein [Brevibacillus daliensis]|uniref:PocR ligand-binding domain-containing protein n=1 Tax=Brevibacillus daliensis TaxID=2892995 RepID=UPI001E37DE4F|nr:PocR ligand-binding domain-containing protein [Brevibacillus daliensis]
MLASKSTALLLDRVIDEFSAATQLASVVVDIQGIEVTRHCNFTPFCQLIRSNPEYRSLCQKCDLFGGLEASKFGKPVIYRCHAGLTDFSVPIVVQNQLIGFLLSGQVLSDNDESITFIQDNQTSWHNNKELMAAYRNLPSIPSKQVESAAELLTIISNYYLKTEMEQKQQQEKKLITQAHVNKVPLEGNKEIKKALKYIDKNLNSQITLEEISNYVYLSPYYFSKLFKQEMNVNFITYVNQKKMERAKELLRNPGWSIETISKSLGYTQTSYFCKVFRKEFHITPNHYRDLLQKNTSL